MSIEAGRERGMTRAGAAALGVVAGVSALLFVFAGALMDRGIDLTDEGFYLNSIARPDLYPHSLSQFGPLLHPLMVASHYDIVLLRMLNYLVLVGLSGWLAARVLLVSGAGALFARRARAALGIAFGISALLFYCIWLPTPNYNSTNVIGALLFALGAIGARRTGPVSWADIALAGAGLALCALSKPTTGLAMIPLVMLAAAPSWPRLVKFTLGVGAISSAITALVLLVTRGAPDIIINNYLTTMSLMSQLTGDDMGSVTEYRYLWRSWPFLIEWAHIAGVVALSMPLYASLIGWPKSPIARRAVQLGVLAGFVALCLWTQYTTDWWNRPVVWTPALVALTLAVCHAARARNDVDLALLRDAALLILIPFAVGLGSNTGMLRSAAQAAPLWAIGAILLLAATMRGPLLHAALVRVAFVSVAATAIVITWAQTYPQRQVAPLWTQNAPITAHGRDHALKVDAMSAAYFGALNAAARAHGFEAETPVIDLTGTSPATIYVLGGGAVGWPYLPGGYAGSQRMLERVLDLTPPADLARAWVLTSGADYALSPDALRARGLDFPAAYEEAGRAVSDVGGGEQTLWRPRRDQSQSSSASTASASANN